VNQFVLLQGRSERFAYATLLAVVLAPLVIVHPMTIYTWWYLGLVTLLVVVCTCTAVVLAARRLHDVGLSGWYALLLLVPVLNLPGLLLLVFVPGAPGPNRWGVAPLSPLHPTLSWFTINVPFIASRHMPVDRT